MSHVSLCSGIGGLDYPFGTPDVFYEIAAGPSEVLAARFPGVPNLDDFTTLEGFSSDVTLVTGGLPCQPVSAAGKGKGSDDERYLFDDLVRVLAGGEARPTLFLENVRGLLYPRHRGLLARFVRGLADLGYVGRWECVRASDVGAPHRRERWFCVASHPDGDAVPQHHSDTVQAVAERVGRDDALRCGLGALRESRYGPAVARWEQILGRPAPAPLDGKRLNASFVEWMMGFPQGWVTDILPRTAALKALGNAVVPQQAVLACRILMGADHEDY